MSTHSWYSQNCKVRRCVSWRAAAHWYSLYVIVTNHNFIGVLHYICGQKFFFEVVNEQNRLTRLKAMAILKYLLINMF